MRKFIALVIAISASMAILTLVVVAMQTIIDKKHKAVEPATTEAPQPEYNYKTAVSEEQIVQQVKSEYTYEKPISVPKIEEPADLLDTKKDAILCTVSMDKILNKMKLCEQLQQDLDEIGNPYITSAMQYFLYKYFDGTDDIKRSGYPAGIFAPDVFYEVYNVQGKAYVCCITKDLQTAYLVRHYSQEEEN